MISNERSLAWYLYKNFFEISPTVDFISNSNIFSLYDNLMLAVQIWRRLKIFIREFLPNQNWPNSLHDSSQGVLQFSSVNKGQISKLFRPKETLSIIFIVL